MSFLTPARLQDCSRILRGVALVAAKAAADSPALKRAGNGDVGNAMKEAMKSMSQQTKQIAEILDSASREQTGLSMEVNMRRTQEAYEGVASAFTERTSAAVQEGQQAAQSSLQDPKSLVDGLVNEGRRLFEGAAQTAQRAADGGKDTLDQAMRQGQEAARAVAPEAARAVEQAARDVQHSASSAGREAAEAVTRAAATAAPLPKPGGKAIILDFAGGSGTATGGSVGISSEAASAAATRASPASASATPVSSTNMYVSADKGVLSTDDSALSASAAAVPSTASSTPSTPTPAPASSTNMYVTAEKGVLSTEDSAPLTANSTPSTSTPAPPVQDQCFIGQPASGRPSSAAIQEASEREDMGWDEGPGLGSRGPQQTTPPQQPTPPPQPESATAEASNVLRNQSNDMASSRPSSGPEQVTRSPAAATEAARLAEEERRLSEKEAQVEGPEKAQVQAKKEEVRRKLRERRVPSSPMGRVAGFAQLGASLVYGTVADQVSSYFGGQKQEGGNRYLTERNAERLADALCRMRGAALKLGQMISIQDENVLPPQLSAALERVRAGADVMPRAQLHEVLNAELGSEWRSKVASFEDEPLAAASIGQVHGAVLHDGRKVVLKIQYPGVARSIESDVDNMLRVISLANILPKGMYIENAAKVAKKELKLECDYEYEARCQLQFVQLIREDPDFKDVMHVPMPIPELCSSSVLCSEWVPGVHIDKVSQMEQPIRDAVGTLLLQLTLRELFEWRFMQTDPNWGNFLYDQAGGKLNLIDFGAAREFPSQFVDDYLSMVKACAERDRDAVVDYSTRLGFLTGDESKVMLDAHSNAGFVVGTPFAAPGLYDFASHHSLTKQVSELGAVMLKHRLTPPPEDSYSLHRKLSGAFLACIKLRAKVPCRQLFYDAYEKHKWGHQGVTAAGLPNLGLASGSA